MVGESPLQNKRCKNMKQELAELFNNIPHRTQVRIVAIFDTIGLQIAYLDQELQIAAGVKRLEEEKAKNQPESPPKTKNNGQ